MPKEYHYVWEWDLASSPEALWSLVSDTNRFNRDTGLPPMQLLGIKNRVKQVRFKIPLIDIVWDEEPFEWTYPYRFGILRRYKTGPLLEMRVDCRLERREQGTHLRYEVWATSRNFIGDIAIPFGIGFVSAKRFGTAFANYDRIASSPDLNLGGTSGRNLSLNGFSRLQILGQRLHLVEGDIATVERMIEYIQRADDISIQRMRPYALADGWG